MLAGLDIVLKISLRLNEFTQIFQTIDEIPGIARRLRSTHEQQTRDRPIYNMIVRRKLEQVLVFRIPIAVKLSFHLSA